MSIRQLGQFAWENLGHCLKCMRAAFLAAATGWTITGLIVLLWGFSWPLLISVSASSAVTILWLSHLIMYSVKFIAASEAARAARADQLMMTAISRRTALAAPLAGAIGAFVFAAIATVAPSYAGQQKQCRVCDGGPDCCQNPNGNPNCSCYTTYADCQLCCDGC